MNYREIGHKSDWLQTVFEQFEAPLLRYAARLVGTLIAGGTSCKIHFCASVVTIPNRRRTMWPPGCIPYAEIGPWTYAKRSNV